MARTATRVSHLKQFCTIAATLLVSGVTTVAHAAPIPAGQVRLDALRNHFAVPGGGYAGELVVNASQLNFTPVGLGATGLDSSHFISFCVETTETLQLKTWYDADLNTESRNTYQPVRAETAYLYSHFIKGDLENYRYFDDALATDTEKAASARALQEVIWYYQDPTGFAARYGADAFDSGGYFKGGAIHKVLARSWYASMAGWIQDSGPELSNVRILNVWEGANARQDMLVMIPLPAPLWLGSAGLTIMGLGGAAASRRRLRQC